MTNILIALIVLLAIIILIQITRVSELLGENKNEDVNEVTDEDNNLQGILLLIIGMGFIVFVIWQMIEWNHLLLPPAASLHGKEIDSLMKVSMTLILVVFFILCPLLFYFGYRYRGKKTNKAYFFSHSNKLEIIWTAIPTVILTALIIYGLRTWDKAMNVDTSGYQEVEIFVKQFQWTGRYPGEDNVFGESNYQLIDPINTLGINFEDQKSFDDKIVREVHLVVDKPILLKFRSQDVIHSAFLPHFRVQMNCVPGLSTQFAFTPTKTTAQMKKEEGEDFEYVLLCNKICGSAHYNMQMKFVVETQEEYDQWIKTQKTVSQKLLTQN